MTQTKRIKRDKPAKIRKIVSTTKKLVSERGYSAVTTHHIAEEAGVSVGLVYKYFPGGKPITVKIFSNQKGKIMGAQAVGDNAAQRINMIATAILANLNIEKKLFHANIIASTNNDYYGNY